MQDPSQIKLCDALISRNSWKCFPKSHNFTSNFFVYRNDFTEVFVDHSFQHYWTQISRIFILLCLFWQLIRCSITISVILKLYKMQYTTLGGCSKITSYDLIQTVVRYQRCCAVYLINQEANFITDTCEKQISLVSNTNYFYSWKCRRKILELQRDYMYIYMWNIQMPRIFLYFFNGLQCKSWVQFLLGAL